MIGNYKIKEANKELKALISQRENDYEIISSRSRSDYLSSLPAGASIPPEGQIYGNEYLEEFRNISKGYAEKADEIITPIIEDIFKEYTEAPSQDAINAINVLNMRNDVTEDEFDYMLTRYGRDNVQTYKALKTMAAERSFLNFRPHPIEVMFEEIKNLEKKIASYFMGAERTLDTISRAAINSDIDAALPIEE